ncbi:hypothetical protein HGRIS_007733 [Hohenbuehelia grisea]|uniref:Uncharacterized protein n=1 Tax=Hohenbuehelia grisea TaxID=104357 RepID=A0ABR3J661_9AGAR
MDGESAQVVINLLTQEIKALNGQLRLSQEGSRHSVDSGLLEKVAVLESENRSLKQEVATLERKLSSRHAGGSHLSDQKSETLRLQVTLDETSDELAASLIAREKCLKEMDALREKNDALSNKHDTLRTKYKASKALAEEVTQASNQVIKKLEESEVKVTDAQADLDALRKSMEKAPEGPQLNLMEWVSGTAVTHRAGRPKLQFADLTVFLKDSRLDLPKGTAKFLKDGVSLHFNINEVLWPSSGMQRLISLHATHRYNPKLAEGWEPRNLQTQIGDKREVFFLSREGWIYCGRYCCKHSGELSPLQMKELTQEVCPSPEARYRAHTHA